MHTYVSPVALVIPVKAFPLTKKKIKYYCLLVLLQVYLL